MLGFTSKPIQIQGEEPRLCSRGFSATHRGSLRLRVDTASLDLVPKDEACALARGQTHGHVASRTPGRLSRTLALCAGILLLGGCASGFYANVTSYQKWPADAAGQTYRIVPDAGQNADHLEYQAISDMVRANIGTTGLIEAVGDQSPRFHVRLHYENPATQIWTRRYADYDPWFMPYGGYYGYPYGGWGGGMMMYAPPMVTVPVQVYRNTLTIWITDTRGGNPPGTNHAEVYRATAIQLGENNQLIAVMPYLARAIFDGFPGNNGQVRQVRYDPPRE